MFPDHAEKSLSKVVKRAPFLVCLLQELEVFTMLGAEPVCWQAKPPGDLAR